jgi:DNA-binding transcriptional MerR regulator
MDKVELDPLIDIDAACLLAGVKPATIKSWARKDRILAPVDALGDRGKNRYRTSDVLQAMKIRGIRPPLDAQLPFPQQASAPLMAEAPSECAACARKDRLLDELQARVEALEGKNAKLKEIARLALSAS